MRTHARIAPLTEEGLTPLTDSTPAGPVISAVETVLDNGKFGTRTVKFETGLLARSVWVIGPDGKVAYRELVADQTHEPDYEALLAAVRAAGG